VRLPVDHSAQLTSIARKPLAENENHYNHVSMEELGMSFDRGPWLLQFPLHSDARTQAIYTDQLFIADERAAMTIPSGERVAEPDCFPAQTLA
jgi:hypothetical protein